MQMNVVSRRDLLRRGAVAAAAFATPALGRSGAAAPTRPNILFLLADDQRCDTIAAHGNRHIKTPNLDALAARGYSFRQNYCLGSSGGAVCVPSRAMIHSGRAYFRVDSRMTGVQTLGQLLKANGYVTFATGKWHNRQESFLRSFERGKAIFFGGMADHTKVPVVDLSPDGRLINKRVGEKFSSELFTNAAIEFLEGYRAAAPFFAYVAFTAPHDPRNPPPRYRQMYYDNRPPLPPNFMPQHPFDNGHMVGRDENLAAWPRSEDVVRDQLAEYYGLITHLDEHIGRILEALERSGHADNTLIVYAADHGLAVGSHGLLGKQNLYEHSMGCPLIFAGPGIPPGRSTRALTYLMDIYPTICSATGIRCPTGLDGRDLRPIWQGKAERVRETLFLSFSKVQRAVRDHRWKMIRYPQINHTQLFDLEDDPHERRDLAAEPQHAARMSKMLEMMRRSQEQAGDTLPLSVERPGPKAIDLSGRKREPDRWQPEWIRRKYFGS